MSPEARPGKAVSNVLNSKDNPESGVEMPAK